MQCPLDTRPISAEIKFLVKGYASSVSEEVVGTFLPVLPFPSTSGLFHLSHPASRGTHSAVSGDIVDCTNLGGSVCYCYSSGWRPGTLLSIPWCAGQPPPQRMIQPWTSVARRPGNPDLWKKQTFFFFKDSLLF